MTAARRAARRPILFDERQPPDLLGRSVCRLRLGDEELGEVPYVPYDQQQPGGGPRSYHAEWVGQYPDNYLHVTLPDGREFDCCAIACSFAEGDWSMAARHEKAPRAKRAKGTEPVRPRKVQALALEYEEAAE